MKNESIVVEKHCRGTCGLTKPVSAFSICGVNKNGTQKYNSWCKECFNTYQKQKRQEESTYETVYTKEFLSQVKDLFDSGLGKIKIAKELDVHKCKVERELI